MVILAPRIEAIQGKLNGKPCIKDTRIPVWIILEWLEAGESIETIIESFEGLKKEDVTAAISFAKAIVNGEISLEVSS